MGRHHKGREEGLTVHDLCGRVHTSADALWFCWAARTYYGPGAKRPRRTRDEVVTARVARAKAVAARREFHAKRKAARLAAKEGNHAQVKS